MLLCNVRAITQLFVAPCTAVILAVLVAVPSRANSRATPDTPIRIEKCAILSRSLLRDPFNALREEVVTGLFVRFSNARGVPATTVTFLTRYQGSSQTIVERGSFAPNVPIDRTFATFAGNSAGGDAADCTVISAIFGDGSVWGRAR